MDILCYQPTGSYFWKLLYSLGYLVIVMALCDKKNFIKSALTCIFLLKWLLPCKSLHNKYHHKHQWWVFMCLASSSFPHLCQKRCTFQLCWHFQCASSKYKLCGTFFHRCYSWTRFFCSILGCACWIKVDCWILFHNRQIDFECSWLKVRVTTIFNTVHNALSP